MKSCIFCSVTLDMYRMLQAVERQPVELTTSSDERATVQSPAPTTNHQHRDIYVRIIQLINVIGEI
jgi:hypothetical protein